MLHNGVTWADHSLNDCITAGAPGSTVCQHNLQIMLRTCEELRLSINPDRLVLPTSLEFLGRDEDVRAALARSTGQACPVVPAHFSNKERYPLSGQQAHICQQSGQGGTKFCPRYVGSSQDNRPSALQDESVTWLQTVCTMVASVQCTWHCGMAGVCFMRIMGHQYRHTPLHRCK